MNSHTPQSEDVSARRLELLKQRLSKKGIAVRQNRSIPRRSGTGPWPLSFAQRRFWFLKQLYPNSAADNLLNIIRLGGDLDIPVFEKAFSEIVRRHEILRTTFELKDGIPVQIVSEAEAIRLPMADLSLLGEEERTAEVERVAREEGLKPFDLSKGPLMRVGMMKLGEGDHVVMVTMHHIISDGWSMNVLVSEVSRLYEGYKRGEESEPEEPGIQYADYAVWQQEWMRGEAYEEQMRYWKERLAGLPPPLDFPADFPRSSIKSASGGFHSFVLPEQISKGLRALSESESATIFMTMITALQTLLNRYTGMTDICVGSAIANRTHRETERLVGFFANTIVYRADFSRNPTFRQLLRQTRRAAIEAHQYQEVPFEKIVEELKPERLLNQNPIFQVGFGYSASENGEVGLEGLTLSFLSIDKVNVTFDLSLEIFETPADIRGIFYYKADLFKPSTIARLAGHFLNLLGGIITDPDNRVSRLPLMSDEEIARIIEPVKTEAFSLLSDEDRICITDLFNAQAQATPHAIAVLSGQRALTFEQLDGMSNRLASYLVSMGVGPEVRVAICMKSSAELLIGLLGILKAGGAYVVLDPVYPLERLAFILEESLPPVILTQEDLIDDLPSHWGQIICLDSEWDLIESCDDVRPVNGAGPENLAYILYTSGSTGKPKGVMVTHGGLANYLNWAAVAYRVGEGSGAPSHSPISFDLTITSLFTPLIAGKSVVLVPQSVGLASLAATLQSGANFSLVKITPAHLDLLSELLTPSEIAGKIGSLVIGGEALFFEKLAFWRSNAPETRIINEYGPTETVVGCCVYEVNGDSLSSGPVPIGRPINNTKLYILDNDFQPVPVAVTGELYIAGSGLARGYVNRPGTTAEKFLPNPFAEAAGERMYRTGDLARYLPDGDIEYVGRNDEQVKIRGYRIELGEIESRMKEVKGVKDAVVIVKQGEGGEKRLIGYVVMREEGEEVGEEEIRRYVKERLPEYMVPVVIVKIDVMPMTENGKLDRGRLPEEGKRRVERGEGFEGPRTAVEHELAAIWRQLLRVEEVGIYDDFFDLGGHSLLLTQLSARIRETFGVELPLRVLFDTPTIEQITVAISEIQLEMEDGEEAARMLAELQQLSPDEVRMLLEAEAG